MGALYRSSSIRAAEQAALAKLAPGTLMRRAAQAIADAVARQARALRPGRPIVALVGPGNNGGDALLAAMLLRERAYPSSALLLDPSLPAASDARAVRVEAQAMGFSLDGGDLSRALGHEAIFIDGLFGIGLSRPLSGLARDWTTRLNEARALVISVDIPSGLDADTGAIVGGRGGAAVHAQQTVSFLGDKPGLHTGAGIDVAGEVRLEMLGVEAGIGDGTLIDEPAVWPLATLLRRRRSSHKGSHGTVRVMGGAAGMRGAALLAAMGAQRAGAGKVAIARPDEGARGDGGALFVAEPQLMYARADDGLEGVDVVVVGCGLGQQAGARQLLRRALACPHPLVIDADALNLLAATPALQGLLRARNGAAVLTPHPLEAARLLGCPVELVQSDRVGAALRLARALNAVCVLKGAGTICASPQGHWAIVAAGSPSLATAGTGDVLAGTIGALIAQGLFASSAACLGAWIHAEAGTSWARSAIGNVGMSAAELPDMIRSHLNRVIASASIRPGRQAPAPIAPPSAGRSPP